MFDYIRRQKRPSAITLADRARDAGQWELAAEYYRTALRRRPNNPPIWVQYGHVLKEGGRLAEAERAYQTAVLYDPGSADSHLQLGRVLKIQGRKEEAWAVYLQAFVLDPLLESTLFELAQFGWTEARLCELRDTLFADQPTLHSAASTQCPPAAGNAEAKVEDLAPTQSFELQPEDFVTTLYRAVLRRPADPTGLAHWSSIIRDTGDHTFVLARFVEGDEFKALSPTTADHLSSEIPPMHFQGGDFFRSTPVSRVWGADRGTALDRPFIEHFIQTHAGDVHGRVLEIGQANYARTYGCRDSQIDVLDIDPENAEADIIDDLQSCSKIGDETYDCLILTQVVQFVPDFERMIATAARILRPGGILLLTTSGITQAPSLTHYQEFFWSFFKPGLKRTLSAHFDKRKLLLDSHGNVGLAASFLMGLAASEVPSELFSVQDPEYPIVLTARAAKPITVPTQLTWKAATTSPDISVIIPMYNAERTIKETLFSVSKQSYDSYEILLIDDGSTDTSRKIVDNIAATSHGRLRVLQHADNANRGLSLSRNLGIEHARGKFLVFLDADDNILPQKLAHDIGILRTHPEAAAVFGRALWWWDGSGEWDAHLDRVPEPANRVVHPPEFFNAAWEAGSFSPCPVSCMFRKSATDAIEPFDPYVMTYEDQKYFAELSLRFPVYITSTCLGEYRRADGTLWASAVAAGTDPIAAARFLEWKARASRAYSRK